MWSNRIALFQKKKKVLYPALELWPCKDIQLQRHLLPPGPASPAHACRIASLAHALPDRIVMLTSNLGMRGIKSRPQKPLAPTALSLFIAPIIQSLHNHQPSQASCPRCRLSPLTICQMSYLYYKTKLLFYGYTASSSKELRP